MRWLALFALFAVAATACTSETKFGTCVGLLNEKENRNPKLRYEYNNGNIAAAVVFSETIVVPAIVLAKDLECPVAEREIPTQPTVTGR